MNNICFAIAIERRLGGLLNVYITFRKTKWFLPKMKKNTIERYIYIFLIRQHNTNNINIKKNLKIQEKF